MPNHVTNIIRVRDLGCSSLDDVRCALLNNENVVDFNIIAQRPECLDDFQPHCGIIDAAKRALGLFVAPNQYTKDISDLTNSIALSTAIKGLVHPTKKEDIQSIIRAIQNYHDCGYFYWYDWQVEHWETKWNAYSQPDNGYPEDATEFSFQTAWSHPAGLIKILSTRLPEITLEVIFADEDTGSNCGNYICKSGEILEANIAPSWGDMSDSEKAKWTEFSFRVQYPNRDPREHGYGPDWVYSEEVYEAWEAEQEKDSADE